MPAALGLGSLRDHAHCVSSCLPPRLLLLRPDPTSTVAPHEPLALRSNLATAPGRTSSDKQSQPRRPAALQTPLPSCPAWGGQDAQPSPGKAHPAPQRQHAALKQVNIYSGCSPEPRGCHPGSEAHEAHTVPQPRWQQHFHPHAVPGERSGPVPRCSSPQHCSGCIGLLQARGIYTKPAWMVPINGRLHLAKASASLRKGRVLKDPKKVGEGGHLLEHRDGEPARRGLGVSPREESIRCVLQQQHRRNDGTPRRESSAAQLQPRQGDLRMGGEKPR